MSKLGELTNKYTSGFRSVLRRLSASNPLRRVAARAKTVFYSGTGRKLNLKRIMAWSGAALAAIGVVTFAAMFLDKLNDGQTSAVGPSSANITVNFRDIRGYNAFGDSAWGAFTNIDNSEFPADWDLPGGSTAFNGSAYCIDPGLAYPGGWPYGSYNVTNLVITPTVGDDSVTVVITGSVATGGGHQRLSFSLSATIKRELPAQPVTVSQAQSAQAGQVLKDDVTVLEADKEGNQVTDPAASKWRRDQATGNLMPAEVCVDVYGPYYDSLLPRNPAANLDNKFFLSTPNTVTPPPLGGSQVTIIGGAVANASQAAIRSFHSNTLNSARFYLNDAETISSATAKVGTTYTDIRDYVVLALGPSVADISAAMAAGGDYIGPNNEYVSPRADAFKSQIKALIDKVRQINPSSKIVLWMALDVRTAPSSTDMKFDTDPLRPYGYFSMAVSNMANAGNGTIAAMNWLTGELSNNPTTPQAVNVDGVDLWGVLSRNASGTPTSPSDVVYRWSGLYLTDGYLPNSAGQTLFAAHLYYKLNSLAPSGSGQVKYTGGAAKWGFGVVEGAIDGLGYPGEDQAGRKLGWKCFTTTGNSLPVGWGHTLSYDSGIWGLKAGFSQNSAEWPAYLTMGTVRFVK